MKFSAFLSSVLIISGDAAEPKLSPLRVQEAMKPDLPGKKGFGSADSASVLSTASLEGDYMIIETIGSMEGASLGIVNYDGQGGLTGNLIVNYPDPESPPAVAARIFWNTPLVGTYELGDNGIGTQNWTYKEPPEEFGDELTFDVQLLVTSHEDDVALEVDGNYQQPSPFLPVRLVTYESIKRPQNERGGFFTDSLKGNFGLNLVGVGNGGIGFGVINFDGEGNLSGFMNGNGRGDEENRNLFFTDIVGTYSVEHHGFGFVQWTFTGPMFDFDIDFLIVKSTEEGQATELRMQFQVPSPLLLGLVTTRMTLLD